MFSSNFTLNKKININHFVHVSAYKVGICVHISTYIYIYEKRHKVFSTIVCNKNRL